ncbi:MAG: response regulator [Hungatella sp.]|nr:response regulator [Hungatella sp.]
MFVDDEDKMRGLLRICIPWEELDYEIVNDVSSANQALELIACDKPDVIITDIEMPFINGLDFAEMVLEEYPHIKIVALTAHDEFDYAKQGLEIGISNFLLKPIKKEELIRVMTDIQSTIREDQKKLYQHELLQRKLNENRSFIIQNFLSNMMVSSLPSDYLWENLAYYQIPVQGNYPFRCHTHQRRFGFSGYSHEFDPFNREPKNQLIQLWVSFLYIDQRPAWYKFLCRSRNTRGTSGGHPQFLPPGLPKRPGRQIQP